MKKKQFSPNIKYQKNEDILILYNNEDLKIGNVRQLFEKEEKSLTLKFF